MKWKKTALFIFFWMASFALMGGMLHYNVFRDIYKIDLSGKKIGMYATTQESSNAVGQAPMVTINWDDTCGTQYSELFQLALKYRIPQTLFLTLGRLDTNPGAGDGTCGGPYLTLAQVLEMDRSGLIELAAHSWDHDAPSVQLAADQDAFFDEEKLVFDWFETNLGHPPYSYATPGGDIGTPIVDNFPVSGDPDVLTAIRTLGYENHRMAAFDENLIGGPGLYAINSVGLKCNKPISATDADGDDYIDIVRSAMGDANSSFGISLVSHSIFPSGTCTPTTNVDAADLEVLFIWLRGKIDDGELEVVTFREFARRMYKGQRNLAFNGNFYEKYGQGEQYDGDAGGINLGPQGWKLTSNWDACITHSFHGKATITHASCSGQKTTTLNQDIVGVIPGARYSIGMHFNITTAYTGGDTGIYVRPLDHGGADNGPFVSYGITAAGHHFVEYDIIPSVDSFGIRIIAIGTNGVVEIDGVNVFPAYERTYGPGHGAGFASHPGMYAGWSRAVVQAATTAVFGGGTQAITFFPFNTGTGDAGRAFSNRFMIYRMKNSIATCTDWDLDFCDLTNCTGDDIFHSVDETMDTEVWNQVFYYENEDYPSDKTSGKVHAKLTNNDGSNTCTGTFLIEFMPMGLQEYGEGGTRRKEN